MMAATMDDAVLFVSKTGKIRNDGKPTMDDADNYYLLDGNACDGGRGLFQCFNDGAEMN